MNKKEVLTNILDRYNQSIISPVNPFTVDNVERRDSVYVQTTNLSDPTNKSSNFVRSLKWIFWIICASVVLIIVIRIGLLRSLL